MRAAPLFFRTPLSRHIRINPANVARIQRRGVHFIRESHFSGKRNGFPEHLLEKHADNRAFSYQFHFSQSIIFRVLTPCGPFFNSHCAFLAGPGIVLYIAVMPQTPVPARLPEKTAAYLRSLFVFSGRRSRGQFFLATLTLAGLVLVTGLPLFFVHEFFLPSLPDRIFRPAALLFRPAIALFLLALLWSSLCLAAHRLRDAALPVWLAFVLEGAALAAVFLASRSEDAAFVQNAVFLFLLLLPTGRGLGGACSAPTREPPP